MDGKKDSSSTSVRHLAVPMAAIIVGMFIVYLDQTVLNVILPTVITAFQSTYPAAQWTITGYTLALAAVIPIAGWLSDRFGAKRIMLLSIIWFGAGSLLCALSSSIEQLVLFRIVQGIGGGMVTPVGLAMIYRLSPTGQIGKVMAMISIPILLAPAFGPMLAGFLADNLSWQWVFLINVPICLFGVLHGIRYLPSIGRKSATRLDLYGLFLAPIAVASLCYGMSTLAQNWHSVEAVGGLSTGLVALLLLVVAEWRRPEPLLEIRVYRSGNFAKSSLVLGAGQIAVFGCLYLLPQWVQNVRGASALEAGLIMMPYAVASGVVLQWSGRWFDRFGVRRLALAGMCGLAIDGFWLTRLGPGSGMLWVILPVVLLGASSGLCMMPLSTHLMRTAPHQLVSRVSSLTGAVQQIMVSLTIAGLTTALTWEMKANMSHSLLLADDWQPAFRTAFIIVTSAALIGSAIAMGLPNKQDLSFMQETSIDETT